MERDEAREFLRERLPKGSKIYVNITHTSKSNMSWSATVSYINPDYGLVRITNEVGAAIDWVVKKGELKGGGVGSDRANDICYALGYALYGDGYSLRYSYV